MPREAHRGQDPLRGREGLLEDGLPGSDRFITRREGGTALALYVLFAAITVIRG
jgi:hypothetical protein